MDATRISDGKYVMLKMPPEDEGPDELRLNRLFLSEPLLEITVYRCSTSSSYPTTLRLWCSPNYVYIMTHHFIHTESLSLSLDICARYVACTLPLVSLPYTIVQGIQFMHENHVAHRYLLLSTMLFKFLILFVRDCTSQNIMLDPSRMYPKSFHPMESGVLGTFVERRRDMRGLGVGHGTFSLTLAFLGNTILQRGRL